MDREKKLRQRQAEWLGRLVQGRPVFVYAWELGRAVPILRGVDECAPFFRPWDVDCSYEYFHGSVAIRTSLMTLVANGYAKTVADNFQGASKVRLSGLHWPHNALAYVGLGNKAGVRKVLKCRRQPHDPWTLLAAAGYWRHVLHDTQNLRQCLDALMPCLGDPDAMWAAEQEAVGTLLPLLRDWPKTETLRWLINTMYSTQDTIFRHAGLEEVFLAQVCMEILGNETWARWLLRKASASNSDCHPQSSPALHRFCRHRLAMLYIELLGDQKQADHEVAKAPGLEHQFLFNAAKYWWCFRDNPSKTRACLTQWSEAVRGWDVWCAADAWMLFFNDKERAMALVEDGKRQRNERRETTEFLNAKCRFALFGDRAPMDRLLAESRRSGATWEVKNWLLHDLGDIETYHACLTYEESICRTVFDFTSCARDWMEHFGDRNAAERCLSRAEAIADASQGDVIRCAHARLELFDDMSGATRMLQ